VDGNWETENGCSLLRGLGTRDFDGCGGCLGGRAWVVAWVMGGKRWKDCLLEGVCGWS
jgi:hypothetical protein